MLAVALLATRPPYAATRCLNGAEVARLLRNVIAPNWGTVTKEQLVRRWPGLKEHTGIPAWPAELGLIEETPSGEVVCEFSFLIREDGGIKSFSIVLSGTRGQANRLGRELISALGFALTPEDRLDYERKHSVILRRMNNTTPVGIDVDVTGTDRRSYVTVQGYNFDVGVRN